MSWNTVIGRLICCSIIAMVGGCSTGSMQAVSLTGQPLYSLQLTGEARQVAEHNLREAESNWRANPDDLDSIIWFGRRVAYTGDYRRAIAIYTDGLKMYPGEPRLLRHRGHRYISTRRLSQAIHDLSQAAAASAGMPDSIELDGQPNALGIPRSTLQSNIYYHLGLAHYLRGDFESALATYERGLPYAHINDDQRVAHDYWHYLTLKRLDHDDRARLILRGINSHMDVIENHTYQRLLLLYKGELDRSAFQSEDGNSVDDATLAYGLAMNTYFSGDEAGAHLEFERITTGQAWPAFGFIAAEAELARGH